MAARIRITAFIYWLQVDAFPMPRKWIDDAIHIRVGPLQPALVHFHIDVVHDRIATLPHALLMPELASLTAYLSVLRSIQCIGKTNFKESSTRSEVQLITAPIDTLPIQSHLLA